MPEGQRAEGRMAPRVKMHEGQTARGKVLRVKLPRGKLCEGQIARGSNC